MKSNIVQTGASNMGGFFVNPLERCWHCAYFFALCAQRTCAKEGIG
jgi:hypothetical protein